MCRYGMCCHKQEIQNYTRPIKFDLYTLRMKISNFCAIHQFIFAFPSSGLSNVYMTGYNIDVQYNDTVITFMYIQSCKLFFFLLLFTFAHGCMVSYPIHILLILYRFITLLRVPLVIIPSCTVCHSE